MKTRRDFLRYSGLAAAGGAAGAAGRAGLGGTAQKAARPAAGTGTGAEAGREPARLDAAVSGAPATATAPTNLAADPIRPPAAPLAVRGPYLSTWLPATALPGTWQQFWTGHTTAMGGIARIDGVSYVFMGAPTIVLEVPNGNQGTPSTVQGFEQALDQTLLRVTPTRSVFSLEGGGVSLTVEFLSPVETGDLRRQSIPMSYVLMTASSIDGAAHDVQLYFDISGEWTTSDDSQVITWSPSQVSYTGGSLRVWSVQLQNQQPLTEQGDMAAWGSIVWATPDAHALTYQSGQDIVVRAQFTGNGVLANTNDTNYRPINDNWPVFGFSLDLGSVTAKPITAQASIGQVRTPAVSYLGQDLAPLWTTYFGSWPDMLAFFHADRPAAQQRADRLDARVTSAAQNAGGSAYAGLCAIALRQAYGGTELVAGPGGQPSRSSRRSPATATSPPWTCSTRPPRPGSTPTPVTWAC